MRKDFPDAIYWMADLVTDADGRARVAVTYPDALTTWRLTARAVTTDTRVGVTVARTTTTKDLIVRIVTPRFLTEGDEVVLPTIVHNYREDDAHGVGERACRRPRARWAERRRRPRNLALAAGAERRDDWRFTAPAPGTATITASARTESDTDAAGTADPCRCRTGFAARTAPAGSIVGAGEGTAEVTVPDTANAAGRTVRVTLAPSLAGSLLGALDFLTSYPYGCTEQTLSSFLPNLLVTRALTELKLAPTERLGALDRQVSSGLRRLADMQHDDGGWGWWKSDGEPPVHDRLRDLGPRRGAARRGEGRTSTASRTARARSRGCTATYPRAEPDLKAYMAYVLRRSMGETDEIVSYGEGEPVTYRHATARTTCGAPAHG